MCGQVVSETTGGGRRTDGGVQNQKQEPHTKMWGKKLLFKRPADGQSRALHSLKGAKGAAKALGSM